MKKVRAQTGSGGFSLAEMLVVLLILSLLTSLGVAVSAAVLSARNRMMEASNADMLGSAAMAAVADELRFGQRPRWQPGRSWMAGRLPWTEQPVRCRDRRMPPTP